MRGSTPKSAIIQLELLAEVKTELATTTAKLITTEIWNQQLSLKEVPTTLGVIINTPVKPAIKVSILMTLLLSKLAVLLAAS
jgi:hypothetical protein